MRSYDVFFIASLSFLVGVLLASVRLGWIILAAVGVACVLVLAYASYEKKKGNIARSAYARYAAALIPFALVGALYFTADDRNFRSEKTVVQNQLEFVGIVLNDPVAKNGYQEIIVALDEPHEGNVLAKTKAYPEYAYGDRVRISNFTVEPMELPYSRYLEKERISATIFLPNIERLSSGNGSAIRAFLFSVKHRLTGAFREAMPYREAAFMSGLTFGEREEFQKEFTDAMQKSGTTHLVALSGYNVMIIVATLMSAFSYFVSKRKAFAVTILAVCAFVAMTGAEASIVRAAIMGLLILLADRIGRRYDVRNVIVLAGLAMVLVNSKVLTFDVGFQLSFLAFLGIAYLKPALEKLFRLEGKNTGFLSWKGNLITTLAAQLAVLPVLVTQFGGFSPVALVANVLVLEAIPLTMGLGFVAAGVSLVSRTAGLIASWIALPFLKYEIGVIELFGKMGAMISGKWNVPIVIIYYILLGGVMAWAKRKYDAARI